jgi:hypothetical protein
MPLRIKSSMIATLVGRTQSGFCYVEHLTNHMLAVILRMTMLLIAQRGLIT